jgi:hypothetical protein
MGASNKNPKKNSFNLKEIIDNSVGQTFIYENQGTMEDKSISVGGSAAGTFITGNFVGNVYSNVAGNVSASINELPTSSESDKPKIKELLQQLQAVIETEPNLSEKDKIKALKQVQAIAEAGKTADQGAVAEIVDNATTMLKGIILELPAVTNSVGEFHKLLPLITGFFGI